MLDIFINDDKGQTQGFCWKCAGMTNHELLYSTNEPFDGFQSEPKGQKRFFNTVKCKGCDHISFALLTSRGVSSEKGDRKYDYIPFPEPLALFEGEEFEDFSTGFLDDSDIRKLPKIVKTSYEALTEVFHRKGARILSGIALRLIIESVCIEQNISGKNLKEKIDNMLTKGIASNKDLPILHSMRDIGNVSAHEIKEPTNKVLDLALEIINHILKTIYIIPDLHKKMTAKK